MASDARIEGLDELLGKIETLRQLDEAKAALGAVGVDLVGRVSPYPPAPPGSTYRRGLDKRSETLGRRWFINSEADGARLVIGNNASYARYEHDAERQTAVHQRTGWKTYQAEWEAAKANYAELMRAYVVRALEG